MAARSRRVLPPRRQENAVMRKQAEKKQEQVRPDGDIRADRRTDAGVDGGARADHNRFRSGDLGPPVDDAAFLF